MIQLLLLRHAQTLWNAEGRWQGWSDVALSPKGREDAAAVGPELVVFNFAHIVASDLDRTRETALLINRTLQIADVTFDPALRERSVGVWSGKTSSEIDAYWPGDRARVIEDHQFTPQGGESRQAVIDRVVPAIQKAGLLSQDAQRPVLVVTHGGVIRNLAHHLGDDCGPINNLDGLWITGSDAENLNQGHVFRPVNSRSDSPITSL